uniref:DUF1441 family protein n=1 Tax=Meloidogyne hapla TaxID=6305 RepID=A0A1I8BJK2_MELHA
LAAEKTRRRIQKTTLLLNDICEQVAKAKETLHH